MEQRVHELEQLVQQRDNEIAIMVNMIRKEHGATIPAELLSRGTTEYASNQDEHHQKPRKKQSAPAATKPPGDYASTFVVDPAILEDPAKAFEAFKAQYPKNDAIRDNKIALKRKYDAAKALASEVNEARNQIKALTLKIEKLRKQQAIADEGLIDEGGDSGDASSAAAAKARAEAEAAEQKLKDQIDGHKVAYKKGFNELSELKKEIQHIQKMLEMGRIKLQKDFDLWYQRQGKGALLTETLLAAQAKPEPTRPSNNRSPSSENLRDPVKSSSPERPESASRKSESKAFSDPKRASSSHSQRSSVARQSTSSTVEEDVSGFYEALDILKRRSNARK